MKNAPAAWIKPKTLEALSEKNMVYVTGFDLGGSIPLYLKQKPIYDEAKERELFEEHQFSIGASKRKGASGVYFEITTKAAWLGWRACAQSRAKAGEDE